MATDQSTFNDVSGIFNLIIGTAGHIDHGKSSLVRRLTGVDPDRLPEERAKGITIDLGFAPWALADGRRVGVIDVPGHERFIKNMVAGASGIDVAVLVVAADDGIMPQTIEHFEILCLLGIEVGVVALTKCDLADPELVEVVILELREFLAGSFLETAPIVPVSSTTGDGFEELKTALGASLDQAERRPTAGPFRMPVQRVFSAKGFGTILTGVPISGAIAVGDSVEILPLGIKGKVRGLQAYKEKVKSARAGHSTAINIPDVDYKSVSRGVVVATPGVFRSYKMVELRFQACTSLRTPILNRTAIRLHCGTHEALGELIILDAPVLTAGESALCQVRLEEAVVVVPGDRFIARRQSPLDLLGGGEIIGLSKHRLKAGKSRVIDQLSQKQAALGSIEEQLELVLRDAAPQLLRPVELAERLNRSESEVASSLQSLSEQGLAVAVAGRGDRVRWLSPSAVSSATGKVCARLLAFHEAHRLRLGMSRRELCNELGFELDLAALIVESSERLTGEGSTVRLTSHEVILGESERILADAVLEVFQRAAFITPSRVDAWTEVDAGLDPELELAPVERDELLSYLIASAQLVVLPGDLVLHNERYQEAKRLAIETIQTDAGLITSGFKEALASSRKYVIPLLEHFDAIGLTIRQGDKRILRKQRS